MHTFKYGHESKKLDSFNKSNLKIILNISYETIYQVY